MDKLFDDISRVLASPVPRRRALRLIFSGLVGTTVAAFGLGTAQAFACPSGQFCCPSNTTCTRCCSNSVVCCNSKCCNPGDACISNKCKAQPPSPTQPC